MSTQTGLADRERFEAFSQEWRDTILKEARKWCSDERAAQLLTDAVLADFRRKYADSDVPRNLEYFFRAQACLVYSATGQNIRKIQYYIAEHSLPDEELPPELGIRTQTQPPQEQTAEPAPVSAPVPEMNAVPDEPAPPAPAPEAPPAPAEVKAASDRPAETPAPPPAGSAAPAGKKPDTFLDPVRTTFWTPDDDRSEHVVEEMELPDEEEDERSVVLSFLNVVLFLLTTGAFAFCVYETGFVQYLLQ